MEGYVGNAIDSSILNICKHRFHSACIEEWFLATEGDELTCPLCRRRMEREIHLSLSAAYILCGFGFLNVNL